MTITLQVHQSLMKELCIFISKKDYDGLWEGPLNDSCFFLSKKTETEKLGRERSNITFIAGKLLENLG